jgi:catecholate siderophore receptor
VLKGPNAMIFGRGGGGGVINRVTKQADWRGARSATLELGSWDHRRLTADLDQPLSDSVAGRVVGLYERSESYRDGVFLERWAINPTLAWRPSSSLSVRAGYEHFEDRRTADRGIASFAGRPAPTDASTFFGDPDRSYVSAEVDLLNATLEYAPNDRLTVRNRTLYGDYDKFYQNVFASGEARADARGIPAFVPISAYNNATQRRNLFNQTDVILKARTGPLAHTLLVGAELGRQVTDNLRTTGFFNNATSVTAGFANPTVRGVPITFRSGPTDASNHVTAEVAAAYLQDQVQIGPHLQLVAGVRFDRFELDFRNNRTGERLSRTDDLVSPRLGVVVKPVEPVSLYASYSVSYLPSAGDQFSSLNATSRTLEPEEFENYEVGAKWDVTPELSLSAAAYRLDRTNTTARDPDNPAVTIQTGAQRTRGLELAATGQLTERWEVAGGYAWQDAEITSTTTTALAGKTVALTPRHTASLWNKVRLTERWGAGLGVVRQGRSFAAVDNTVVLPGYTRVDVAVFLKLNDRLRAQVNVENLFDRRYFPTSQGNNNILPGAPRSARVSLTANF